MKRVFSGVPALAVIGASFVGASLLSACLPVPPPSAISCDAAALEHLVGQNLTVLQTMRFGITTRIIGPDTAVTKDFNPDRLNITHDRAGLITDVGCF